MINNYYDVIVVGGGPSGSMAAIEVAKAGFSVCILEILCTTLICSCRIANKAIAASVNAMTINSTFLVI